MVPEASRSPGRRLQPLTVWWVSCWSIVQYMCCGQGHGDREVAHPSLLVGNCTVTHDRRPPLGSLPVPQPAHPGHSQQPRAVLPGSPSPRSWLCSGLSSPAPSGIPSPPSPRRPTFSLLRCSVYNLPICLLPCEYPGVPSWHAFGPQQAEASLPTPFPILRVYPVSLALKPRASRMSGGPGNEGTRRGLRLGKGAEDHGATQTLRGNAHPCLSAPTATEICRSWNHTSRCRRTWNGLLPPDV